MKLCLILLGITLTACVPKQFERSDDPALFEKDSSSCKTYNVEHGIMPHMETMMYNSCMIKKGWVESK